MVTGMADDIIKHGVIMYQYNYKGHVNKWWYEIRSLSDFSNVSFPVESELTNEILQHYNITRHEYTPEPTFIQAPQVVEKTLEEIKSEKLEELRSERIKRESYPVLTDKGLFDFDKESRDRYTNVLETMSDNDTRTWTTSDGVVVTMSKQDFRDIRIAASERSDLYHIKWNDLKTFINNSESIDNVKAISWDVIHSEL